MEGAADKAQSFNSMENGVPRVLSPAAPNVLLLTVPKFTVPVEDEAPATLFTEHAEAEITPIKLIVPSLAKDTVEIPMNIAIVATLTLFIHTSLFIYEI
jgi:hypothetical protein